MATFTNTWDAAFSAAPASSQARALGATRIMETRLGTYQRLSQEHYWAGTAYDGMHVAGSAMAYYQASAPTNLPGTALGTIALGDNVYSKGRLWFDTDTYTLSMYTAGGWRFAGAAAHTVALSVTSSTTENTVFDTLSPLVPNVGDYALLSGASGNESTEIWVFSRVRRYDATTLYLYYTLINLSSGHGVDSVMICVDGNTSTNFDAAGTIVGIPGTV